MTTSLPSLQNGLPGALTGFRTGKSLMDELPPNPPSPYKPGAGTRVRGSDVDANTGSVLPRLFEIKAAAPLRFDPARRLLAEAERKADAEMVKSHNASKRVNNKFSKSPCASISAASKVSDAASTGEKADSADVAAAPSAPVCPSLEEQALILKREREEELDRVMRDYMFREAQREQLLTGWAEERTAIVVEAELEWTQVAVEYFQAVQELVARGLWDDAKKNDEDDSVEAESPAAAEADTNDVQEIEREIETDEKESFEQQVRERLLREVRVDRATRAMQRQAFMGEIEEQTVERLRAERAAAMLAAKMEALMPEHTAGCAEIETEAAEALQLLLQWNKRNAPLGVNIKTAEDPRIKYGAGPKKPGALVRRSGRGAMPSSITQRMIAQLRKDQESIVLCDQELDSDIVTREHDYAAEGRRRLQREKMIAYMVLKQERAMQDLCEEEAVTREAVLLEESTAWIPFLKIGVDGLYEARQNAAERLARVEREAAEKEADERAREEIRKRLLEEHYAQNETEQDGV